MNKKLVVAGSIFSSLLLIGGIAYAKNPSTFPKGQAYGWYQKHQISDDKLDAIATKLGLNPDEIKQELNSGKNFKQILQEHKISLDQLRKSLEKDHEEKDHEEKDHEEKDHEEKDHEEKDHEEKPHPLKMSTEMIQAEAKVLGLSVDQLKQDIANKQRPAQIAKSQGMTAADFHKKVVAELHQMIKDGSISADKAKFYEHFMQKQNQKSQMKTRGVKKV